MLHNTVNAIYTRNSCCDGGPCWWAAETVVMVLQWRCVGVRSSLWCGNETVNVLVLVPVVKIRTEHHLPVTVATQCHLARLQVLLQQRVSNASLLVRKQEVDAQRLKVRRDERNRIHCHRRLGTEAASGSHQQRLEMIHNECNYNGHTMAPLRFRQQRQVYSDEIVLLDGAAVQAVCKRHSKHDDGPPQHIGQCKHVDLLQIFIRQSINAWMPLQLVGGCSHHLVPLTVPFLQDMTTKLYDVINTRKIYFNIMSYKCDLMSTAKMKFTVSHCTSASLDNSNYFFRNGRGANCL